VPSRREVLIEALGAWRAAGDIDDETHERLARRVTGEPVVAYAPRAEASALGEASAAEGVQAPRVGRGFGADSMQFVGGLLVGAGLVALVIFLDVGEDVGQWLFLGIGVTVILGAVLLHFSAGESRRSLIDAAFAVGFVPLGVGATQEIFQADSPLPALLAFATALGVHVLLQGRGPATFLATACASLASLGAVLQFFDDIDATAAMIWLLLLLGYLALALIWRRESWSAASAGALVIPISIAFIMFLVDALGDPDSVAVEISLGLLLGALLGVGIWLGVRALVASAAGALTIDAVVFAFDIGGPGTAVVVLLALGGLLVWQGRGIRDYLRRAPPV